jgi:uncharacterized membrane protein
VSGERELFMARLRQSLAGAPPDIVAATLADIDAHFEEGRAAGRDENAIAAALGDPQLLGEQFRLEADLAAWEHQRSSRSGIRLVLTGLRRVTLLVAGPLLASLLLLTAGAIVAVIALLFGAGVWMLFQGESLGIPGGAAASRWAAFGLMFAALSLAAAVSLATLTLVNRVAASLRRKFHARPTTGALQ